MEKDPYSVLQVKPDDPSSVVKNSFREKAMMSHPDSATGENDMTFIELQKAHDILTNEPLKQTYDEFGHEGVNFVQANALTKFSYPIIQRKIRKKEFWSKQEWWKDNINSTITIDFSTTLFTFLFSLAHKKPVPFPVHSVSHQMKIPVTNFSSFTLHATLAKASSASVRYRQRFGQFEMFSKLALSSQKMDHEFEIGIKKTINDIKLEQSVLWKFFYPHPFGLELKLTVESTIFNSMMAWFTVVLGLLGGVSCGFKKQIKKVLLMGRVDAGVNGTAVSANTSWSATDKVVLGGGVNFPLGGLPTVQVSCMRIISKLTNVTIVVDMNVDQISVLCVVSRWGNVFKIPLITSTPSIVNLLTNLGGALFGSYCGNKLILNTYDSMITEKKLEEKRKYMLLEKNKVEQWKSCMVNSIQSIREQERDANGLVIIKAYYGDLSKRSNFKGAFDCKEILAAPEYSPEELQQLDILDVTDAIQYQVHNSQLNLPPHSKVEIPGIYDPCRGSNFLEIIYSLSGKLNHIIIKDNAPLAIPPHLPS
eukprot:TRINITY_DN16027_c0_g1_i1.p1 TRINITY_DN16027_c0_g1~~TRINITY_DN16027_c0_g1_i1.p1  ORF type:complete len:535 (+),score=136.71 TRINITY_DN16027_c0_g1_i1:28-1632(+)